MKRWAPAVYTIENRRATVTQEFIADNNPIVSLPDSLMTIVVYNNLVMTDTTYYGDITVNRVGSVKEEVIGNTGHTTR